MEKHKSRLLVVITAVSLLIITPFRILSEVHAAEPPTIGFASQQMTANGNQDLTVSGGCGGPYSWSLVGGSGVLSGSSGSSINYTAPSTNPNCVNNPTIRVTDSCGQYSELKIAVNARPELRAAYMCESYYPYPIPGYGLHYVHGARCDGSRAREGYYYNDCEFLQMVDGLWVDIRTPEAKAAGCCPDVLLTSTPPGPEPCRIAITGFNGSASSIDPYGGGDVRFSGGIDSNRAVSWTITVAGRVITGSGTTVSASWDGRDGSGKLAEPGSYTATLSVVAENGGCSDTRGVAMAVKASDVDCKLIAGFESSANLATGNLYHAQPLFTVPNSMLMPGLVLSYNSADGYGETMGIGWTHTYNVAIRWDTANDRYILRRGDGSRLVLYRNGNFYTPERRSYPALLKNADGTMTLSYKDGIQHLFDVRGKLTRIMDRNGNAVNLVYDGNDRLTMISDPAGKTISLAYNSGRISNITDPNGNSHTFTYGGDTLAQVLSPTPLGLRAWTYAYDSKAFLLAKTDLNGNTTQYAYGDAYKIKEAIDPEGKRRAIQYDPASSSTRFTEKDGGVWTYKYDPTVGVLREQRDPGGNTVGYLYDGNGNLTQKTDPDGGVTVYTYDGYSNITSVTDPSGGTIRYTYNPSSLVTSITDAGGNRIQYDYDASGNLISVTDPVGAVSQYRYDAKGNITGITAPNGGTTRMAYDSYGNLISITDPKGGVLALTYDRAGNITGQVDPQGNTTRFQYDDLNHLIGIIDSLGKVTRFTYDHNGNRLSVTDANGNTTQYAYNHKNSVTRLTDALGHATEMVYGGGGCASCATGTDKLSAITDANRRTTSFEYDSTGRLIRETDPMGSTTTYAYDAKGNLLTRTKPDGRTITYRYDASNRLTQRIYPDNTTDVFRYDPVGNMIYAGNQHIAYAFAYDVNNRMTGITDSHNRSVHYRYDAAGNRTAMTTPEGKNLTYLYDSGNLLTRISTDLGEYKYHYDSMNRRTRLGLPNGTYAVYGYDAGGRLTSIIHKNAANRIIDTIVYGHDDVGNRTMKTDAEAERGEAYGYDAIYRLIKVGDVRRDHHHKKLLPLFHHPTESYAYDPVGNRLTGPQRHDAYDYDAGNRLLNDREHQYQYDPNGNLIRKTDTGRDGGRVTTTTYGYDDESRLIRVETKMGRRINEITFTYDPFGRRITKTVHREESVHEGRNAEERAEGEEDCPRTTQYVYDGHNIILEYNHKGTVTKRYVHGPGMDEPLSITVKRDRRHETTYYYHADGLGSIIGLTDSRGQVVQRYEYDSFGKMTRHGHRIHQAYTFTGREYDPETGLYYYRARYYDPMAGRFISKDPIGFAGGDVNMFAYVDSVGKPFVETNLFVYTQNNPINWIDPYGLYKFAPSAKGPLTPGLDSSLQCFETCVKEEVTVTSGVREGNKGPHGSGNACDLGSRANSNLDRKTAESCFSSCFSSKGSYGQEEKNSADIGGTHYHFQNQPGRGGAYGFPPGVKPYQP